MELEVRHLRALCAIADAGSVRKAARQLGMTQPSLTTQLRRIERAVGGDLFSRERTGVRPTPLGRSLLGRARPIVAEMSALVADASTACSAEGELTSLRIGSTGCPAVVGWLRRLHDRLPETDTAIHIDTSASALLQMLAAGRLDVAFVHEVHGFPLRLPDGLDHRLLLEREPQFVCLSERHPAARRAEVPLSALAGEAWIVDPAADGEPAGLRRVLTAAGVEPRLSYVGNYSTGGALIASGEAVGPCQPTSRAARGTVLRPLRGDPLTVRLFLAIRPGLPDAAHPDALLADLAAAYTEAAWANPPYRRWLQRHGHPAPTP